MHMPTVVSFRKRLSTLIAFAGALVVLGALAPAAPIAAQGSPAMCPPSGVNLTGAGSTFAAPIYTQLFQTYAASCGVQVNYQAIGSGGGIQQLTAKTVAFGASDGIMTADQKAAAPGVLAIPTFAGPVAMIVNIPGLQAGDVHLDGSTLAGIYSGQITNWNDSRLQALNSVQLPNMDIITVHRSDGSGTTNIFTTYLSAVSPAWQSQIGAGNSVNWPNGIGGEGSVGVAGQVSQLPGSIGYVEFIYATQNNLASALLYNSAGQLLAPTLAGATTAMNGVSIPDSTEVMFVNSSASNAYPISGFTWVLVYQNQTDPAVANTLVSLL